MGEIIKNVLVTAIVLFVMRLIMTGVERKREEVRKSIEEENSSKGKKKNNNPLTSRKIVIEYGKGIKVLMLVAFIAATAFLLLSVNAMVLAGETVVVLLLIFGSFALLCAVGVGGTVLWRITLEGDNIEYSDYLGIKHHYKWDEISKVLICAKKIKVYKGNRVIFTVDDNVPEGDYLIGIAKERNIPVELDDSFKKYCDKNGIKYQ